MTITLTITEIIAIITIFVSPVAAVFISNWYQKRQERIKAKQNIFLTLLSYRGYIPIPYNAVMALNQIKVVFHRNQKVILSWEKYYHALTRNPINHEDVDENYLNLLHEMASVLGYGNLKQTQLNKSYLPQQYANDYGLQHQVNTQLLQLLTLYNEHGLIIQDYKEVLKKIENKKNSENLLN